jgi:hypothetical protein
MRFVSLEVGKPVPDTAKLAPPSVDLIKVVPEQ